MPKSGGPLGTPYGRRLSHCRAYAAPLLLLRALEGDQDSLDCAGADPPLSIDYNLTSTSMFGMRSFVRSGLVSSAPGTVVCVVALLGARKSPKSCCPQRRMFPRTWLSALSCSSSLDVADAPGTTSGLIVGTSAGGSQ